MRARRHLLDRRTLLPRDYLVPPERFGTAGASSALPDGGDPVSCRVAVVQHELACALHRRNDHHLATRVATTFGFSTSFWSDCLLGKSWMGETVLAAAVSALLDVDAER